MKFYKIFIILCFFINIIAKSQDYSRHLELSLLFYECQRSGPLPKTNRIYWRHDSLVDAGSDVGLDLTGGYYDAGDNVKFNFPQAASITLLAWSGIEFKEGFKKSNQYEILLDTVKWATDYFIRGHPEKDVLYVQVGDGITDHSFWYPPEYIDYKYPSYKIDAEHPGSEVAGETAASLAATSILFKNEDSVYSELCLKHAIEIYEFADTYRGDYTQSVPNVVSFYASYSGFLDELAWAALWLYRATGDVNYYEKYNAIADVKYDSWDPRKFSGATGPISWDDKRPGCYILAALVSNEEKRLKEAYNYCDAVIAQPTTPGGLWYDDGLSIWASNRYAANAASMVAIFANYLPESDNKRNDYIKFVKSQIDYILGDNPEGINYVVGAEDNSPKSVHHRGASGVYDSSDKGAKPEFNIYTLYGALAGGPGKNDNYVDDRSNYQMNEVALDYNAGFTICLASLVQFGLNVEDKGKILEFDRAWPQKAPTPDIRIKIAGGKVSIATGSGMMCSGWCILLGDQKACNIREKNFLDGEGTFIETSMTASGSENEFEVLCDGYHANLQGQGMYKPEFGHLYKVIGEGGPENTKPLFEESKCWPSHIC